MVRASMFSGASTESRKLLYAKCCLCPPNTYVEALAPTITVVGGGALGRSSVHDGGPLMRGIGALINSDPRVLSYLFHCLRTQREDGHP